MNELIQYFKTIAETLKVISHHDEVNKRFFVVENMAGLTNLFADFCNIQGTIMCVTDIQEGRLNENSAGNMLDIPEFSFWIFQHANQLEANEKLDAKTYTKQVVKKVLSKMFKDQTTSRETRSVGHIMMLLDRSSIQYFSIGPVMDGLYGTQVSFNFAQAAKIIYDENDWK